MSQSQFQMDHQIFEYFTFSLIWMCDSCVNMLLDVSHKGKLYLKQRSMLDDCHWSSSRRPRQK